LYFLKTSIKVKHITRSAIDLYFVENTGQRFTVVYPYYPYFYVKVASGKEGLVSQHLTGLYPIIHQITIPSKEDLDMVWKYFYF
jgi:hypothetical protein